MRPTQAMFIDIAKGLNQDIDPQLMPQGFALTLSNAQFTLQGQLALRNGHSAHSDVTSNEGETGDPWQLGLFRNGPVNLAKTGATYPIYWWADDAQRWSIPSTGGPSTSNPAGLLSKIEANLMPEVIGIDAKNESPKSPDVAYGTLENEALCVVWEENGTVEIRVTDATTRVVYKSIRATGTRPKVVYVNNGTIKEFVVFYCDNNDIKATIFRYTSGTHSVVETGTIVDIGATNIYDCWSYDGSTILLGYDSDTATGVDAKIVKLNASMTATAGPTTISGADCGQAIAWLPDFASGGKYILVTAGTTNGVHAWNRNTDLTANADYAIDASATADVHNVSGYTTGAGPPADMVVYYEIDDIDDPFNQSIKIGGVTSGSPVSPAVCIRSVGLRSRVFQASGVALMCVTYSSDTQGSYFIVKAPATSAAVNHTSQCRFLALQGGGLTEYYSGLTSVASIDSTTLALAVTKTTRLSTSDGFISVAEGVAIVNLSVDAECGPPKDIDNALYTAGGQLRQFDGSRYEEAGFALWPEQTAVAASNSTGSIADGTYSYVSVYKTVDINGNVWRSAPSPAAQITVSSPDDTVTATVPCLRITGRSPLVDTAATSTLLSVEIELYRTENAGTVYYLVGAGDNDEGADSINIVDGLTDAQLVSGELLYTNGNVLENLPPPSCKYVAEYRGRPVIVSSEYPNELWVGKEIVPGQGLGFHESLIVRFADGTRITGVETTDDRMHVITETDVHVIYGDFPDNQGTGVVPRAQRVCQRGSDNPRSICVYNGVWFQDKDDGQIYQIDRGLTLQEQIGRPVRQQTGRVYNAIACPDFNQVRFYRPSLCTVLDLKYGVWATWTLPSLYAHAIVWNGRAFIASSDISSTYSSGYHAESSSNTDQGTAITFSVKHSWIAPGGPGGEARIRGIHLAAEGTLAAQIDYNYGADDAEDYDPGTMPADIRPRRMRCTSISVRVFAAAFNGALSGIGFDYQVLTRRMGTTRLVYNAGGE